MLVHTIMFVAAVIAKLNTEVSITFSVKSSDLLIEYNGGTYTKDHVLNISLATGQSLQISANADLTGEAAVKYKRSHWFASNLNLFAVILYAIQANK